MGIVGGVVVHADTKRSAASALCTSLPFSPPSSHALSPTKDEGDGICGKSFVLAFVPKVSSWLGVCLSLCDFFTPEWGC